MKYVLNLNGNSEITEQQNDNLLHIILVQRLINIKKLIQLP